MKKSYIEWWIAAGLCLLLSMRSVLQHINNHNSGVSLKVILFLGLAVGFFFTGYKRYKMYQAYQKQQETHRENSGNNKEKYWEMDDHYIEKIGRRKNVTMEEFRVAGVSKHQDLFPRIGYLTEEYNLSDEELEKIGIRNFSIPKYGFGNLDPTLEPDPDNEFDPNAVKVFLNGEHVGYIRAEDSKYIHDLIVDDRIADVDGRIVGGPSKRYNPDTDKIDEVDWSFGIRLQVFIKKD